MALETFSPAAVQEMTAWRRDLHAYPEFGFEKRSSAFVAAKLREFGLGQAWD